ncbi:hypothetical protein [Pseudofrankia sp. DC12]|uniref:hypothetical protein n=1 Tax=Pseudofrankia sp. DC12 TaxID=683315 RepID=UPI0012F899D0|nr:hypothetical protein [Pseudofrankia sp. DC12]
MSIGVQAILPTARRRGMQIALIAFSIGMVTATLSGCGARSIAERTYYGPPAGAKEPTGGWVVGDVGAAVAVIEAPDQLHVAIWENPMCHGIPESLKVIDPHTVQIIFHKDGVKGCRKDPNYPNGTGPLTSVLRLDPQKVDSAKDVRVLVSFAGGGSGEPLDDGGGIIAHPIAASR